ncbi:MAG: penicillin-binding protein 2, partial [Gammaproteobacteria bacterium]
STIKPYFALEGLDAGIITPDDTLYDPGWFELPNYSRRFHDQNGRGHGTVNVSKAIMVSCDTFFYTLAVKMGIHRMDAILTQFGFGSLTGIDLDDELPGVVASPEWKKTVKGVHWYNGDTVNAGIGQGLMQATPIQLANGVTTLANRGQRYIPYLLLGEQTPGKTYTPQPPTPLDPVKLHDPNYWEVVIDAMQEVVESPQGTAYRSFGRGYTYTIAAKTGTGQVSRRRNPNEEDKQDTLPEKLRDHNLFIAFAPVDKPKIALVIVTEHSHVAAETARIIFDYYLGTPQNANRPAQIQTQKTAE